MKASIGEDGHDYGQMYNSNSVHRPLDPDVIQKQFQTLFDQLKHLQDETRNETEDLKPEDLGDDSDGDLYSPQK